MPRSGNRCRDPLISFKGMAATHGRTIVVDSSHPSNWAAGSHGPELSVTEARAGERRGLYRILARSVLLASVILVLTWIGMSLFAHSGSPQTAPNGQPISRVQVR